MKSNEEYRKIVADLRTINATNLERQASNAIEELLEAIERRTSIVRVETPLGAIIARPSDYGKDYPGMFVELRRTDADQDLPLALVEFINDETDAESTGHITIRVYGDALGNENTVCVTHEKIDDYFNAEDDRYHEQQEWIDKVIASLGCITFRPDYHGKAGDMNTVLAYSPEDAANNCMVGHNPIPDSDRDEEKLHGHAKERQPFWRFANTDKNGLLDLGYAENGCLDLRGSDWKDRIEGSIKLAYFSNIQRQYVHSMGGYLNIKEADDTQNDFNRELIKAFHQAYGKAIMGRINPLKEGEPIFWEYTGGAIYNFACDFVLREEDNELRELIQSWRDDQRLPKKHVDADTITSKVKEVGGELFVWY